MLPIPTYFGLQVDVLHCLVRGHLLDELGRTSRKCGGCFHCHSWTPHPMEKEATIADDHDDDVFDVNASGDEYTDYPGDGCYKTTRDQFLLWEYTGIIPQYVELLLNVYLKYAKP